MTWLMQLVRELFKTDGRRGGSRFGIVGRRRTAVSWLGAAAILLILILALDWWRAAMVQLADQAPPVRQLQELRVTLRPNEPVLLGHQELGQGRTSDSADERHLELTLRDPREGGGVFIRNVAPAKRLLLQYQSGLRTFAERFEVPRSGAKLELAGATADFDRVEPGRFELAVTRPSRPTVRFRYDQANWRDPLMQFDGSEWRRLPICQPPGKLDWLGRLAVAQLPGLEDGDVHVAFLGGALDCLDESRRQIGLPDVGWRQLQIVRRNERFFVAAGPELDRNVLPIRMEPKASGQGEIVNGFAGLRWRIDEPAEGSRGPLSGFTAGRTYYELRIQDPGAGERSGGNRRVVIVPKNNVQLLRAPECASSPQSTTCPRPFGPIEGVGCMARGNLEQCWSREFTAIERAGAAAPGGGVGRIVEGITGEEWIVRVAYIGAAAVIALLFLPLTGRRSGDARTRRTVWGRLLPFAAVALSILLSAAPELASVLGLHLDLRAAMTALILNWFLAGLILILGPCGLMLGLIWVAVTVLAATGALTLAAMAVDGSSTQWVTYFVKHKYLFLDVVPPLIVAVAVAPISRIKPFIQELVVGTRPVYAFVRWAPAAALVVLFALWALAGSQTGVRGFQPVEAGKFAAAVICATLLLGFNRSARPHEIGGSLLRRVISFGVLVIFAGMLLFTPVWVKDYSPALIVGLLLLFVGLSYAIPLSLQILRTRREHKRARYRVPLAFRPKARRGRTVPIILGGFVVLFLVLANFQWLRDYGLSLLLNVRHWPPSVTEQIDELERALGQGRSVPVERFLAWRDLSYKPLDPAGSSSREGAPRAHYRDIELQVIRSRTAIAHASCATNPPVSAADRAWWPIVAPITHWLGDIIDAVYGWDERISLLCEPLTRLRRDGEQKPPRRRELTDFAPPIFIPVVQSDFAAAYLFARLGIGAAVAFYLAQAMLVVVVLIGLIRIHVNGAGSSNPVESNLRQFLATLIAGAIALYATQWTLAWANVLGLLPVMGQPMTWLSAATSHHLFMALPCLVVLVVALRFAGPRRYHLPARIPPRGGRSWLR